MKNDFFENLLTYARKVNEPENLFSGRRIGPNFELPDNILVFFHDYTAPLPNAHGRHTLVIPFDNMTYYMECRKIELYPGCLLYVPPYAVRFLHPNSSGYRRLFITFDLKGTPDYLPPPEIMEFTDEMEKRLNCFLERYQTGNPESASMALAEFLFMRNFKKENISSSRILPEAVEKAVELIETHLSEIGGIKQIALKTGLSESHLRQLFRKSIGCSLGQFIAEKKLDFAKYSLACTKKRIAEIAEECGFANIYVFSAFFRRNTGIPPLRYRKMKQKISDCSANDF